jgi:hypothetical protein
LFFAQYYGIQSPALAYNHSIQELRLEDCEFQASLGCKMRPCVERGGQGRERDRDTKRKRRGGEEK